MPKESGLYYPDGSFSSSSQIRRKLLAQELTTPLQLTPASAPRSFDDWQDVMNRRQKEVHELLEIPERVDVEIATKTPILVGLFGDLHAGGDYVDYERFGHDVKGVKSVNGYFMALGDLTDSYFWSPAMDAIARGDEQVLYAQSALDEMAKDGHLLAGWGGDHDMWARDRMGAHTLYSQFHDRYNAHYLEGVSYVNINLNDGETETPFGIVGAHRHKGFSVYNDAHASLRQFRDEGVGSVASVTAHNHVKAHLRQVHKVHNGEEVIVNAIALGAYKQSDRYSRKNGWARKGDKSLGAFGVVMRPGNPQMEVYWTIDEALEKI